MATTTWNGSNDNWNTPADWTGGVLPTSTSDVVINSGTPQVNTNVGTVASTTVNSTLNLYGGGSLATTGFFTNNATVDVDSFFGVGGGGSSLTVGGLLTNIGTFNIGDSNADQVAPSTVTVKSLANTGTINLTSKGSSILSSLVVQSVAGFGTAGSLTGSVNLHNDASIVFTGGGITDIAANSQLTLANADSYIAIVGSTSSNSALTGLATIEGGLTLYAGASINTTGGLTNGGNIYVDTFFSNGGGGSSLTVSGLLNNLGTLDVGDQYSDQISGSTVTANTLANAGTINITSFSLTLLSTLYDKGAAGLGSTGVLTGQVTLVGDALLEFGSGQITDLKGNLELDGSKAFVADMGATSSNSALAGLTTIEASSVVDLRGVTLTTTSAGVANSGTLRIDQNYDDSDGRYGGANVTFGGTLANSGTLIIGNNELGASTAVRAGGFANTGTVYVQGDQSNVNGGAIGATFTVSGLAGFGTIGTLTGTVNVYDNAAIVFTGGGQITDIQGSLTLDGSKSLIADSTTPTSESALAGLATIEASANVDLRGVTLTTTGGLSNAGTLRIDQYFDDGDQQQGGSNVTVKGTLTNSGTVNFGAFNIGVATTFSVAAVNNTGYLNVGGDQSNVNGGAIGATLNVTGAAGFGTAGTVTGNVGVYDTAEIVFAGGGQITDVQGSLELDGSKSLIADSTTPTSNSALAGLATIEANANVDLRGVTLTTTGGLSNAGTLRIDQYFDDGDQQQGGSNVTVKGTLTNSGTVNFGAYNLGTATTFSVAAVNNTGNLNVGGDQSNANGGATRATLNVTGAAGFGTAGTVIGNVGVYGNAEIVFAGGGQITDVQGSLELDGSKSLIADASTPTSNSALAGLKTIEASANVDLRGVTLTTTGGLSNAGTLRIDQNYDDGDQQQGGSNVTVTGTLNNSGTVNFGSYALSVSSLFSVGAVVNTGTLNVSGAQSNFNGGVAQGVLDVSGVAGFGTAGVLTGTVYVDGNGAIVFAGGGQITDVQGSLTLDGSKALIADSTTPASNSALAGLATIEANANVDLRGLTLTTTGGLNNAGTLRIDQNYDDGDQRLGGSNVTIKGTLTNSGAADFGTYALAASSLVTVNAIANTGSLSVFGAQINFNGGAFLDSLDVASAAGFGTAGTLTGNVDIDGDAVIAFAGGGQITDVQGSLTLDGSKAFIADSTTPTSNSALAGLATIEANAIVDLRGVKLTTSGGLNNAGTLRIDQNYDDGDQQLGGANVTIKGTLTNSGAAYFGSYALAASSLVTVNAIANTGTLDVYGSQSNFNGGAFLASLDVGSAAGFGTAGILTGSVDLDGDAVIAFAGGGQITDVQGSLELDGSKAFISDAGATSSNSALSGLATIEAAGNVDLRGVTLTTTSGLSNAGNLRIDEYYDDGDQQSGGSNVTIKGALTNTGYVQVGVGGGPQAFNETLQVGSLNNSGNIVLNSGATGQVKLAATGAIENSGGLNVYFDSSVSATSFTQDATGEITLELQGTDAAHHGTVTTTGGLTLNGGTLNTPTYNYTLAANQTFDLFTFAPGKLVGMFSFLGNQADGATFNLGNNLLLGLEYDDSLGVIEEKIVTAPTSTADSWTGGSADFGTVADWSNGLPDFYSAVTISTSAAATVTLSTDKTIDSLVIGANDTLTTKTGTDLSIGTGISVAGALTIGGEAFVDGAAVNNGAVTVNGLLDIRGAVTGSGGFTLGANAELELGAADSETVTFNGAGATLKLDQPAAFAGTLANLAVGDIIDVAGIVVASPTVSNGTALNFTDSKNNSYSYTLTGFPGGAGFVAQSDGNGGTELIVTPPASTVTLNPIDGNNIINKTEANAGITVGGSVTGLTNGATFSLKVVDGTLTQTYTATVSGSTWSATLPASGLTALPDGSASFTAFVSAATQASQTVVVHETLPTLTINKIDGNNIVDKAQAQAGVSISGGSTGLNAGATFSVSVTDGSFSKTYTATVGSGGGWSASIPSADAITLANGTATVSAKATDAYGNVSAVQTQTVTVQQTLPTLTLNAVDGNNVINHAQAAAGVAISGGSTGLAQGATFTVTLTDGTFSKGYLATVGTGGAWTASVPSTDATTLGNGTNALTVSAQATDAYGNVSATASETVTVAGNLPTLTISAVDGNNVVNHAQAAAGVTISGASTGLAQGATFLVSLTDGSFSKSYTATVGAGGAWTASVPASDATGLADGTASLSAQATDAYGNPSNVATDSVAIHETLPTVTINAVDGNNVINHAEANAAGGVALSGVSTGLASGSSFLVSVVDGTFSKSYTATVGTGGAWTATIPEADAVTLTNGVGAAKVSATVTDAYGNVSAAASQTVTVEETLPTLTISPVDGNNVINSTQAHAAGGVPLAGTVTGLASGATFNVTVVDGLFSKTYTATVGTGGAWTATIPEADASTLAVGTATVSAQATDAYGNVSATASQSVTVAGNAPTVAIAPIDGNDVINNAEAKAGVAISGTSTGLASGATFLVSLVDGTFSKTYTATVGTGGAWTATVPASDATTLANGTATVSAQATDAFGNVSAVATQSVNVQETLPTLTISPVDGNSVINNAEAKAGVAISGTSTGLASGATFLVSLVDGTFSKTYTATVGTGGAWTATVPASDATTLANGTATVSAKATDAFGNVSAVATQSVNVQETLPTLTIAPVDGNDVINNAEAKAGVAISGTSTGLASGATFLVSLVDGTFSKTYTATVGTGGAWTATVPASDATTLANGTATVSAKATDAFGNVSAVATQSVNVQETLPTVTINAVDGNNVINHVEANAAGGVALSGVSTGLASGSSFLVSVVDGTFSKSYTATVGTGGAWTATIPEADAVTLTNGVGAAKVSATVTDAYGNVSAAASQTVMVEETLPTLTISPIDGNNVINSTQAHAAGGVPLAGTVTGLASGATFNVTVVDGLFSKTYTATVGTGGAWTATIPEADASTLAVGTATVSAQATDAYGNVSATASQSVTVAGNAPTVAIAPIDGNDVINNAEAKAGVAISGTSTGLASGATFLVSLVDGTFSKTYTATVGTGGAWTATVPASDATTLANGTATVSAQATDAFGNVSAVATQSVNVQETLPTLTISPVDGNSVINNAEAKAGVAISGTSTGLASGATFLVSLVDGTFSKTYTATVGTGGAWTATVPASDATTLANGTATVSAKATDAFGNVSAVATQSVNVQETLPTLTIAPVDGNSVINNAEAKAGVAISGTSTGLASGATFLVSVVDGTFSKSYTATVGTGGAWTATVPASDATTLANGTATVSAKATDAFGNVSAVATQSVNVQETLPTLTIAPVDGNSVINNAEAKAGVAISGTSTGLASGATFLVSLVDGTFSKTYTATVGTGGAWTATVPASDATTLANGTATVSAKATDAFGNVSAVATQSVNVQETLPTLTIAPVDGNSVINNSEAKAGVAISGTSTGLASGATFLVSLVDGTFSKTYTATVGTGGAWTATVPASDATTLANGTATVSAKATDAFGNVSAVATQSVNVQETLPTLTIAPVDGNSVINNAEAKAGVAISGTSTGLASGATFLVSVVDGTFSKSYTATVGTGGAWTATVPASDATTLANGTATVSAKATDAFGNVSAVATQSVNVQETLPTLTIAPVDGNSVINNAEAKAGVAISGTSTGLASGATFLVSLVDGTFSKTYTATVGTGGTWTATVPASDATTLANGTATVSAKATDAFGNVSAVATQSVNVQETLPTLTIAPVDGNSVINNAEAKAGVAISGTSTGLASGATFLVSLVDGTFSKTYTATVGTGGAWTATVPASDATTLANGTATISAKATDAFGNVSAVATQSVNVQETLPTLTISPVDGNSSINQAQAAAGVTISGASTGLASGATFSVGVVDGTFSKTYTATVGAGGAWTATIPSADALTLPNGSATVSAHATDAYGNVSAVASQTVTVQESATVTINPVDGNNIINYAEAHASGGVALSGTVAGLASGAKFGVAVTDGNFNKTYTATVGANGVWTATLPTGDAKALADGSAVVTATIAPGVSASETVTVAETQPDFTAIAETPATGDFDAGNIVTLSLTVSEAVTVSGKPTLALNDGGVATYDAAKSTATSLAFDYTVGAGDNTPALRIDAVTLGGATILDVDGNAALLSIGGLAQKGPKIDTQAPSFIGLVETPNSGDVGLGKTVTIYLYTSEAVTVSGAPTLALNDGGTATYYAAGTTSTRIAFRTTILAGQSSPDLMATSLTLNGGAILDLAGNPADASLDNLTEVGPAVSGVAPIVTAIAEAPATGDFDAGNKVTLTLTISEAVTVKGAPTLTLNDGGTATYDAANSTATSLAFDYVVAAGQNTASLAVSAIALHGGSILDAYGNATNLSVAGLTQTGPKIDTLAPTFTAVVETPATGDLDAGKTGTIALTASEAVVVTGAPTLTLNDGGVATYDAAKSSATSLVFDYTVAAGQNVAALKATAVNLAGGTIDDLAGNVAKLSLAGLTQTGPQIDTTPPKFTAVTETPATGDLDAGKTGTIALKTSEAVVVAGIPTLTLNDGGTASYDATKSTSTSLVFDYTVAAGQNTAALQASLVNLAGGSILDLAGNAATLSLTGLTQKGPQIDTTPPTFTAVTETPATGDLGLAKTATLALAVSEAVVVTGAPTLILNDGGTASYDAAKSSAKSLVFDYTVGPSQNTPALTAASVSLNGGTIFDLAGNAATLSLTGLAQKGPQIDTTAPTVVSVAGTPTSGDVVTGQTEVIKLTLSEAAKVTGTPDLVLSDGGVATYASGSGTNALTFDYKVLAGQQTTDLQLVGSSFGAGSGIADLAGNPLLFPRSTFDLGVGVNNFVTLTGSETYQIAGPSNTDVVFAAGASADLILTDSVGYTGHLSGLGTADTLDLADLAYSPAAKASYAGTATGGTLTVNDGTHQAAIALLGNFLNSTFTLSNDGYGGVNVVDPRTSLAAHATA